MNTKQFILVALTVCISTSARANLNHEKTMNEANQIVLIKPSPVKLTERQIGNFHAKVDKRLLTGCWPWMAAVGRGGYGVFKVRPFGMMRAHRVAFLLSNGYLDDALLVCHDCDNPICVNPAHLWQGTPKENSNDRDDKGRGASFPGEMNPSHSHPETRARGSSHGSAIHPECMAKGENHGQSKLTAEQVIQIRLLASQGHSCPKLGLQFGVHRNSILRIVKNQLWSHI